jgi:hypothetical protein
MVLGFARWAAGKALKEGSKTIKSVKPGTKFPGQKTVKEHKKKISDIKSEAISKKYHDELKAVGAQLTGKINKSAKELNKLNETLKKQKKILDK